MWFKKAAIALAACAAFGAQAQTTNIASDFSIGSNPGGAWSYGWAAELEGGFNLNLFNWAFASNTNVAAGWAAQNPALSSDANPSVLYLLNGSGPLFSYSTINAPRNTVNLHPGPQGQLAVARWTAPAAGIYQISGNFRGNDTVGTTTDVHVLHNAASLVNEALSGFGTTQAFSKTVTLAAGDSINFAVGTGGNGYFNDSTGLSAIISAVPEPSSYAFLIAGLGVIAFIAQRRQQAGA